MKSTFYKNVPSPVAFFQPLYSVHNGNFQVRALATAEGRGQSRGCPSIWLQRMWALREGWGEHGGLSQCFELFLVYTVGLNLHTVSQMDKKV